MFLRRCAFWAFWLLLALFVLRQPESAARAVEGITRGFALTADALSLFVSAL